MSIAEKLVTIAENQQKVYEAGRNDFGLKGNASGELVTLNNVHSKEHKVEVGLGSKNLFDYEEVMRRWDNNEHYQVGDYRVLSIQLTPNTQYYLSVNGERGSGTVLLGTLENVAAGYAYSVGVSNTWDAKKAVTTDDTGKMYIGTPYAPSMTRERFETALVQIEEGIAATSYTPYITDFSEVKVKVNGKNFYKARGENIRIKPNTKYYLSSAETSETRIAFWLYDADMNELKTLSQSIYGFYYGSSYGFWQCGSNVSKLNFTLTFPSEVAYIKFRNSYKDMQLELGTTATEYEPYVGEEYTPNADGTVDNVKSISPTMNISTDTAGVIVSAECFKDAQKEIESLTTAIALTGGN